jgi:hypothetical protein
MGHGRSELIDDERLRKIYAGVMTSRGRGSRTADCPEPEAILALVRREGAEDTRLAILDHVMSCADCRSEFDLLRSIETAGAQSGAAVRPGRRWLAPAALAASVLLAVVIGRMAIPGTPEGEVVRSGDRDRVTLVAPPPQATTGAPLLFAWHPIPGASRYRLEVMTKEGDVVLEAETADTAITVQSAADLPPGEYQWWVGATAAGATPRSDFRPLRLTSP